MSADNTRKIRYLDLFAGAGGLSEGFIRAGFEPVAHIEMNPAACFTLKTRMSCHWLKAHEKIGIYKEYLEGTISRDALYAQIPDEVLNSVLNIEISEKTIDSVFKSIDEMSGTSKIDLIIGGPPCQAYSLVGRARDENGMKDDKRNYLFRYYAQFLEKYQPAYFVFENVLGLLSAKDKTGQLYLDEMRELFHQKGYVTEYRILSADDYGVLQNRKRIILVGKKGTQEGFYPEPAVWAPGATVSEIFKDLPELQEGEGAVLPCTLQSYNGTWLYDSGIKNDDLPVTWHQARPNNKRDLKIYKIAVQKWNENQSRLDYNDLPDELKTHKNRTAFVDRFKVVAGDLPCSQTVVAHLAKDGHYYIHPDINQNRSITPREAARLQTFPDDYYFESESGKPSRTDAFKQIGNAVPVLLAQKVAEKLKETWNE
jgi:DNA (cytosine-5)-methyltransferase 1